MEDKTKIMNEVNSKFHIVIAYIRILALLGMVVSVFISIWGDGILGFKITLTALVVMVLSWVVKESVDKVVIDYLTSNTLDEIRYKINEAPSVSPRKKSAFKTRLDGAIEEFRENG